METEDLRTGGSAGASAPAIAWDPGNSEEPPVTEAARLASRFALPEPVEAFDFPDKGNINLQTFLVTAGGRGTAREYLLQRINQRVFAKPDVVMKAMTASIEAQKRSIARGLLPSGRKWETITLVPTREGKPFLLSENRRGVSCWRCMVRIPGCRTFKSLKEGGARKDRLRLAEEAGRGLALYIDLTADMDARNLENPLPGYRDTRLYYDQLASVLEGNRTIEEAEPFLPDDAVLRESTAPHFLVRLPPEEYGRRMRDPELKRFIGLAVENEEFAMTLLDAMEEGRVRTVAIHGDTKLDNFLFDEKTGRVKAVVDLDTIMPHTWLADFGDMMRSLANVAGEKERDLSKVQVDKEIYEAVRGGFLETVRSVLPAEKALMPEAVRVLALELGLRFLADYLRGDSYFKLHATDRPDLNKVRAMVQLTLFERLQNFATELCNRIKNREKPP